ncbi:hypothetical protein FDP41_010741 [Naegleria fowleri]|uniref:Uncharacterized protein n=1 Tax=Naegleria fowleri TaxID=5763 RepID=A0A6A5C7B4_NAEFO|nr:uncharacterized protein FDP41_010741 [Naegleria fowleri]KAF0982762.1 hypothetical protein FDP41_010741 [Naegleria fowleri]
MFVLHTALRDTYMRRNDGFVLVFDLTAKTTLEELVNFVEGIKRVKEEDEKFSSIPFVLVGNKVDLGDQRKFTKKEVMSFMVDRLELPEDTPYFESSAKNRVLCDEPFEAMVRRMRKLQKKAKSESEDGNVQTSSSSGKGGLFSSMSGASEKDHDLQTFKELQ